MKKSRHVGQAVFLLTGILCGVNSLIANQTEKPELQLIPEDRIVQIPSSVPFLLQCTGNGSNGSEFTRMAWIDPKGKEISEGLSLLKLIDVYRSRNSIMLRIIRPLRGHSGKYTCIAEYNETLDTSDRITVGRVEVSVNITVLERPEIRMFQNVTAAEGKTAILKCNVNSQPTPNITIWKADDPYFLEYDDRRIEVKYFPEIDRNSFTVTIKGVNRSDEGLYFCRAEANGYYENATAYLEVQFAPRVIGTTRQQLLPVWSNFTNLTCTVEASPPANITWKFEDEEISPEYQHDIIDGRRTVSNLLIVKTNDTTNERLNVYGVYECMARNSLGSEAVNITLREADVPEEISQVIFYRVTPRSIIFKFIGPYYDGGKPVTEYVLDYKPVEDYYSSVIAWPVGTTYIVTNLRPGSNYTFEVAARNAVGVGPWKTVSYLMPEETDDTTVQPNMLITKNVNITDYPDRYEIGWKVHDDYGMLKRYFVVTYFDDGRIKVDHRNGNMTFPIG